MSNIIDLLWSGSGAVALAIGAILLYGASRFSVDALVGAGMFPGRRAFGHWIPIAAAAIFAALLKHPELALVMIFCTSVTAMSLVNGSALLAQPNSETPPELPRLWILAVPVTLITFIMGLAGKFTWIHAVILLVEGAVLLPLWTQSPPAAEKPHWASRFLLRPINFILALGLAIVGGHFATHGTILMAAANPRFAPADVMITVGLAVLLGVAMLFESLVLADRHQTPVAISSSVAVVLLNLCLLLPIVILLGAVNIDFSNPAHPIFNGITAVPPLVFPSATWRVDNVFLLILSVILIPSSLGRWKISSAESFVMVFAFLAYLLAEIFANF